MVPGTEGERISSWRQNIVKRLFFCFLRTKLIQKTLRWSWWCQTWNPISSNRMSPTTDSHIKNEKEKKKDTHTLTANLVRFQIADLPLKSHNNSVTRRPYRQQRRDAYPTICGQSWWLNKAGAGNKCDRQRWREDVGQVACADKHGVRISAHSHRGIY